MEHMPAERLTWSLNPLPYFSGNVWSSPLSRAEDRTLNALAVLFEPGGRTHWHSHPDGQILYVTSGAGRVGTVDGKAIDIGPGDVVYAPSDQLHWHGAAPNSYTMHLSLTTVGATVWEPRAVADEEYAPPTGSGGSL
jgi:quercetin dioxygenase-like cupin family protein